MPHSRVSPPPPPPHQSYEPYASFPDPLPPVLLGGTVNLLAGAPGTGKTAFLVWWIDQFRQPAAGQLFDRQIPAPIPFQGWITTDRSWDRSTVKWFELLGLEYLPHYSIQDDRTFKKSRLRNKRDRIAILKECLVALSPHGDGHFPSGSLIYLDPIAPFLGGNLNDYDACAVACSEIRELALEGQFTVIGTVHASKQKADKQERYLRLQDRILGSAALLGYTDTQLYLASPAELDVDHYTFLWAPHHAPTQTFALERDVNGLFIPRGELEPRAPGRPRAPEAWMVELFARTSDPVSFASLVAEGERSGVSRGTVLRQVRRFQENGRLVKVGRGSYRLKPSA